MGHEVNNGKKFEAEGFGICTDRAITVSSEEITSSFEHLMDQRTRLSMSHRGKQMCSGDGGERVVNIIKGLLA